MEQLSRQELIALVIAQAEQISVQAAQIAVLRGANAELARKLAKLEHLVSRNSGNSSMPPSKDDDPGRTPPVKAKRQRRGEGPARGKGKQPGAPGSHLGWVDDPDDRVPLFPGGLCGCGADLAGAADLGVVDRYQQHEIPLVTVTVTEYQRHQVLCDCGLRHTAARPEGARAGAAGYGPNLAAFVVYLLVMQHLPVHRCVELLESLTGAKPSVGFVHSMIARAAALVAEANTRIRALITASPVVCADETPLRVGPATPEPGRVRAEKYLLVATTERYTLYQLGDRDLATFEKFVLTGLAAAGAVVVHDRYRNYDSAPFAGLIHQLCNAHILRDLDAAAGVYPDAAWPEQAARALRGLIHQANLAREAGRDTIGPAVREPLVAELDSAVKVGLAQTIRHGDRPGERKARLTLEALRDRADDFLRFTIDLRVPATNNLAERDLRPAKTQQKISGRLTSEKATKNRYHIRGYLSTAVKNGHNAMTVMREAFLGRPWLPPELAPG